MGQAALILIFVIVYAFMFTVGMQFCKCFDSTSIIDANSFKLLTLLRFLRFVVNREFHSLRPEVRNI